MIAGRRYLVTGGLGFLGSALVRRLASEGARVRVFDNASRGAHRRLSDLGKRIEIVDGDIRDAEAVKKAATGVEVLCHLAYINGTRYFYEQPDLVLSVAVRGMLNVLDAAREAGVPEFILASSSEVYQQSPAVPTPETVPLSVPDPFNPRYSYGGGKILSELMAIHEGGRFLKRLLIFRPHNVYGPDMGREHVIPEFIGRLAKMENGGPHEFPIQGDGKQTRSFIYIDDFTDALMLLLEKGVHRNIYHIGTEEEVRIGELALEIARQMKKEIRIAPGPAPAGGTSRRCPDTGKIRALGFRTRRSLAAGLAPTIAWYTAHAAEMPAG